MKVYLLKRIITRAIIAALLFHHTVANGQIQNALSFPSVNNTFLGAAGLSQSPSLINVDRFTGTGIVQIPLLNLTSKELSIPVSLSYSGGRGIRLQDYAGPTGLGWLLNAGGGVSRVVRGFPDEQTNGYLGTGLWGQKVMTYINGGTLNSGLSSNPPTGDGEPDIFFIKTPFFNLQFTFDEFGNPITPNNSGLQIITHNIYNSTIYFNGTSFEVIDDKGNQYYFGSSSSSVESTTATIYGTAYTFPTTWYLDKIVSFNSKDIITLNYISSTTSDTTYHNTATYTSDATGHVAYDSTHPTMYITSFDKYVSSINSSLGEADFAYAFDRRDQTHAGRLSTLTLKAYNPQTLSNSTLLKTYTFNYSYFGDPASDPNLLRLRLDNIGLSGNNAQVASLNYKVFTYNITTNLPTRKGFSKVDYFGYFNFNPSITNFNFPNNIRTPYFSSASANVLTGIADTSGCTWNLTYELNDYYNGSVNTPGCGIRVKQLSQTLPTGENLFVNYTYTLANGNSSGQILTNSYVNNGIVWGNGITQIFSESPSDFYDLNGNFNTYSSVKATGQNGGYTVATYSNFLDFQDLFSIIGGSQSSIPDITSSTSFAYKRGLMLDQYTSTSGNNKITEDLAPLPSSYTSKTSPLIKKSYGYKNTVFSYNINGNSGWNSFGSVYNTNVENFLLTSATHMVYDQLTPANAVQEVSSYAYAPDNRLLRSVSTTDSKGLNYTKSFYYSDDLSNIPFVTSGELLALNSAVALGTNATALLVNESDNRNGAIKQTHYSFGSYSYGTGSKILIGSSNMYNNVTATQQQLLQYDAASSNMVTSNILNGKPTSTQFGYNSSYPIAKVTNATNTYIYTNQAQTQSQILNIPAGNSGTQYTTFTSYYAGPITLTITPGSYLSGGVTCFYSYTLTGPVNEFGNLCLSSVVGYTCSVSNTITFSGMPAGNYALSVSVSTNTATSPVPFTYTYTGNQIVPSMNAEFFYEGFEENGSALAGSAHTGNMYWSGNYTVSFVRPNGRSYTIQWWNLVAGKWIFNEQPYTGTTTLTGPVDDVRIFPSDALMTTYTYQPLVGQTSETSPGGITKTMEYDYLSRLRLIRDQDKNIIRKICYTNSGDGNTCGLYYNPTMFQYFTRSCPAGQVGSQVLYNIPANTYISDISQADANQQAQNDINANGQNYANTNGTCTPLLTIKASDSRSNGCTASFTNVSTSDVYNFTINANSNNVVLGQIPQATYNVHFCPINYPGSGTYSYTVNTSTVSGVVCGSLNNVVLTCGTCGIVTVH